MAKSRVREAKPLAKPARLERSGPAAGRRAAPPEGVAPVKKPLARSAAMQLAAEVDRLRSELAAARNKVAELEAKADVDPLLDLLHRRGFERELRRSLAYVRRYGTPAALLYLDLDDFKPVNDRHGHAAGDRVLKAVAATLQQAVRESDVVGRLGGDEFAVLLWNVNEAQAAAKAAELERAIAAAVTAHGRTRLSVTASVGFTMLQPTDAPAEVIARADVAMYGRKGASARTVRQ